MNWWNKSTSLVVSVLIIVAGLSAGALAGGGDDSDPFPLDVCGYDLGIYEGVWKATNFSEATDIRYFKIKLADTPEGHISIGQVKELRVLEGSKRIARVLARGNGPISNSKQSLLAAMVRSSSQEETSMSAVYWLNFYFEIDTATCEKRFILREDISEGDSPTYLLEPLQG